MDTKNVDADSRASEKNPSCGNEMLQTTLRHFIPRPHYQDYQRSGSYTDSRVHAKLRRPADDRKAEEAEMVWTRNKIQWALSKTILQGTVQGRRKRGRQRKRWTDNIKEWTGMTYAETQALAHDRDRWGNLVRRSIMQRPYDPGGLWDQ